MADAARGGGGFGTRGGDRGRGDRGRGGRGRGPRRGGNKSEEKEWQPVTKLGRLVKANKIKSMEEIYLHSLPIKEYQIVDFFLPKLKDEVMKVRRSFRGLRVERGGRGGGKRGRLTLARSHRSSPCRNKPAPASAPASRPSSSSATRKATSVSVSRRQRKSPLPSAPPSSSLSSASYPSGEATGAPPSATRIPCLRRRAGSVGVLL